jgi:predicted ATPase/DNA-binding CsgD family transcriptional regulator/predicted negative regulator of RcsB-dependent stress response
MANMSRESQLNHAEARVVPTVPAWGSPFVGRAHELYRLQQLLGRPECRLITVFGPGGIGKTRLAAELLERRLAGRPASFIALEGATDLLSGIVEGLGIGVEHAEQRLARIASSLGAEPWLLVLDNLEHLADSASLIEDLLEACPSLTIVATSRVMLGLAREWVVPLGGLANLIDQNSGADANESLLLFAQRFEQATGRNLTSHEMDVAARICVLVEGVPLALELTAAWSDVLPLSEVLRDVEEGRGMVLARSNGFPERQQSLRSVFDYSWRLLSPGEQVAFARLAVFRDGFDRTAAEQVIGVDIQTLAALVRKSFLQRDASGRFRLHPLMLQFAREQGVDDQATIEELRSRHAAYFLEYLESERPGIAGHRQLEAVENVLREWANIQAAWEHALRSGDLAAVARGLYLIDMVCSFRARYDEAIEFAEAVLHSGLVDKADEHFAVFTALLVRSWVQIRLGNLDEAEQLALRAESILGGASARTPPGMHLEPLSALATVALVRGDYPGAETLATKAVERARIAADRGRLSLALYTLENALWELAKFDDASAALREAYSISQASGDGWFLAFLHNDLARQAINQEQLRDAEDHLRRSIELRASFGDAGGRAIAEEKLAGLELRRGDVDTAEQRLQRAIALYRRVGDRGGVASSHAALGRVALARGETRGALDRFVQALEEATAMRYQRLVADVLLDIAALAHGTGDEAAVEVLAFLDTEPSTPPASRTRIRELAASVEPARWSEARRKVAGITSEAIAAGIVATLRRQHSDSFTIAVHDEALSPRELQVLRLMAGGSSNAAIAAELGVKLGTAKWYTSQVIAKLGAKNRTEAVRRGRERDLLP